jgi:hypothetical protein
MAELGKPDRRILLPLRRMSTVKIRAGSLFCNPVARNGPRVAASRCFPPSSTEALHPSQDVHSSTAVPACTKPASGCKVETGYVGPDAFRPPRERREWRTTASNPL